MKGEIFRHVGILCRCLMCWRKKKKQNTNELHNMGWTVSSVRYNGYKCQLLDM